MPACTSNSCSARRRMSAETSQPVTNVAAEFRLNDGTPLVTASKQQPLVLVFLRHFGCTFTRQLLRGLEDLKRDADAKGARLVLVHMLKQGEETRYLGGDDVASVADPRCELYRAFGLGKGGLFELFGPRVWWLGMRAIVQGCGVGRLAGNGLQMPGAFVFHHGEITAAQRARTAADLPDLPRLFEQSGHSTP